MDHYKHINSQLIGKMQELKLQIASYEKELVNTRRQVIEERFSRVEANQNIIHMVKSFCCRTIKEVDASVDIATLFAQDDANSTHERSSSISADDDEHHGERRSSADLIEKFRRSNVCHNVTTVSPRHRRRSSEGESCKESSGEESAVSSSPQHEEEVAEAAANQNASMTTFSQLDNICEDNEIDSDVEELFDSSFSDDEEDLTIAEQFSNKTAKRQPVNISEAPAEPQQSKSNCQKRCLRDVTNMLIPSPPKGAAKKNVGQAQPADLWRRCNARNLQSQEDSIEAPRSASKNSRELEVTLKPSLPSPNGKWLNEPKKDSMRSIWSPRTSEITYNFTDAPCSTPQIAQPEVSHSECSTENGNALPPTTDDHINADCTTIGSFDGDLECSGMRRSRRRRCAPSSLAEPKLNSKMRNDRAAGKGAKKNQKAKTQRKT